MFCEEDQSASYVSQWCTDALCASPGFDTGCAAQALLPNVLKPWESVTHLQQCASRKEPEISFIVCLFSSLLT